MIKILMLNYEFPPIGGGAANAHLNLVRRYTDNQDLQIDILTSAAEPGFFTETIGDNIKIHKVGIHKQQLHFWRKKEVIEWLIKAGFHYKKLIRDNSYDLVHAFFGFPSGWLCYRSAGKLPYIISLRGSDVPGVHARLKFEYKILASTFKAIWNKASVLVACSEGLKSRALRFLPTAKIEVIPNGVDLDRYHPNRNTEIPDTTRLLTVGRISVIKRVPLLIDTVEILHNLGLKLNLTIVGGGRMEQQIRDIVSAKNLNEIIKVTGRVESEDMPEIYRQHDILISASQQEGMSNAMLEAMASGLPIITTRCEGVEELIENNGIVVDKPQAEQIAQTIRKLIDDRQAYKQMTVEARKRAETFSWDRTAEQYLSIYRRLK